MPHDSADELSKRDDNGTIEPRRKERSARLSPGPSEFDSTIARRTHEAPGGATASRPGDAAFMRTRAGRAHVRLEYLADEEPVPRGQPELAQRPSWRTPVLWSASVIALLLFAGAMCKALRDDQLLLSAARAHEGGLEYAHNQLIFAGPARDTTPPPVSSTIAGARLSLPATEPLEPVRRNAPAVATTPSAPPQTRIRHEPMRAEVVAPPAAAVTPAIAVAAAAPAPTRATWVEALIGSASQVAGASRTRAPTTRRPARIAAAAATRRPTSMAAHLAPPPKSARIAPGPTTALPVTPSPAPELAAPPPTPSRAEVSRALASVSGSIRQCAGDLHAQAFVTIVFAASGRATIATAEAPYAGTPTGSCMARAARAATIAPFTQHTFSVRAPFTR